MRLGTDINASSKEIDFLKMPGNTLLGFGGTMMVGLAVARQGFPSILLMGGYPGMELSRICILLNEIDQRAINDEVANSPTTLLIGQEASVYPQSLARTGLPLS